MSGNLHLFVVGDEDHIIGERNTREDVLYLHCVTSSILLKKIKKSSRLNKDVNLVVEVNDDTSWKNSGGLSWKDAGEYVMNKFDADLVIFGVSNEKLREKWAGFAIDLPSNNVVEVF